MVQYDSVGYVFGALPLFGLRCVAFHSLPQSCMTAATCSGSGATVSPALFPVFLVAAFYYNISVIVVV